MHIEIVVFLIEYSELYSYPRQETFTHPIIDLQPYIVLVFSEQIPYLQSDIHSNPLMH